MRGAAAQAPAGNGCTPSPRPFVELHFGDAVDAAARADVMREIEHELGEQQIDVCAGTRAGAPVATIDLEPQAPAAVTIRLHVHDAVTSKEVSRTVDAENIPRDSRSLFLAAVVVELLRATWAEIALASTLPPLPPPPPEVREVVRRALVPPAPPAPPPPKPPAPSLVALGVGVAAELFTTGLARFGLDVSVGLRPVPRLLFGGRLGVRRAFVRSAPDGSVETDAWVAGLSSWLALTPPAERFVLEAGLRVDVARVTFTPHAAPGAHASAGALPSIELAAGLRGRMHLTRSLDLALELVLGGAPLGATATDAGRAVASTAGGFLGSSLVLGGHF